MMRHTHVLMFAAALAISSPARGQEPPIPQSLLGGGVQPYASTGSGTVRDQLVGQVGVHAANELAYFSVEGGLPNCLYQLIYVSLAPQGGRAAFATVLSSKRSATPLSTVTYLVQADGVCTLNTVTD
ncbi:hypothetical protein LF41_988 [Lysobacter dokdonensis DS-58]|uniref:Secreted protein n=2 Tax=Noviluteimonas TaxID=3382693 RepID=A0A0A2WJU5_9GAMM|nr:hypothetical protein LF41_988 [Lysobacter dokdonensis DS-58]